MESILIFSDGSCLEWRSCARKEAIRNCKINYDKIKFYEKEAYVLQVFESKTQHLKKGIYEKFITIPELQQSIDAVAKRGSFLIEKRSDTDLKKTLQRN